MRCKVSLDIRPDYADDNASDPAELELFPSTAHALRAGEVLVIADPGDPRLSAQEQRMFERWGFASQLSIPLHIEERTVGLIDLFSRERTDWVDDLAFLRDLEAELAAFERKTMRAVTAEQKQQILRLATDFPRLWAATTTTLRDRKRILRRFRIEGIESPIPQRRIHSAASTEPGEIPPGAAPPAPSRWWINRSVSCRRKGSMPRERSAEPRKMIRSPSYRA